jgi:hypothetical protein
MVKTILVNNTNVSNAVILPILNGTVLFTCVKPAIKQHLDMHQKHVEDVFLTMGSVDTMISMDTTMATSLESVDVHVLFTYVYLSTIQTEVEQLHYAIISFLLFHSNMNKLLWIQCFFPLLPSLNPSFILLLTSFTHWPYSSNIMSGFSLLPTSSLVSTESSTVFTNPISTSPHCSKK